MKDYLKFLKRLPKDLRLKVILAVDKIAAKDVSEYEVYRCRVGKIRILFQKRGEENYVLDMGFRGDVYKKLDNL